MKRPDHREAVEADFKGRRFEGSFTTSSGMVHVISLSGRKSAQLTGAPPAVLARTLLLEIISDINITIGLFVSRLGENRKGDYRVSRYRAPSRVTGPGVLRQR